MLRFGLCCIFLEEPIRFRQVTAKTLSRFSRPEQLQKLSGLCLENAASLVDAIETVHRLGIGAFRILSPMFPRFTHPEVGYRLEDLPDNAEIARMLERAGQLRNRYDVRLSFHPDQFVLLSSPDPEVTRKSIAELDYQAMLAEKVGADVINIHAGGVYGDKQAALKRLCAEVERLPERVRKRLSLENDDTSYTPGDLIPICRQIGIPLVYDVHHHRCKPDGLSIEEATGLCLSSWKETGRGEAYFHLSSPREGWAHGNPRPHADYIDAADFPVEWLGLSSTIDIEAKAKEKAVLQCMNEIKKLKGP